MSRTITDLFRIIAILFVVLIHSTSGAEYAFLRQHNFLSLDFLGVLLNQLGRFSVPLFVMLSGYGLALSSKSKSIRFLKAEDYKIFFAGRFSKILLPYLFLSFVFLFFSSKGFSFEGYESWSSQLSENLLIYTRAIIKGNADYHFYFFVIIIELYFLFPLLFLLASRSSGIWILIAFLLNQLFWTYPMRNWLLAAGIERPIFPSSFFIYWVYYFYFGIWVAFYQEKLRTDFFRGWKLSLPLTLLVISFAYIMREYIHLSYHIHDPGSYNHFHRMSVVVYSTLFFYVLLLLPRKENIKHTKLISALAAASFFVYIYHTMILRLLAPVNHSFLFLFPITAILTFAPGLLISRVPGIPNKIRSLLGLP